MCATRLPFAALAASQATACLHFTPLHFIPLHDASWFRSIHRMWCAFSSQVFKGEPAPVIAALRREVQKFGNGMSEEQIEASLHVVSRPPCCRSPRSAPANSLILSVVSRVFAGRIKIACSDEHGVSGGFAPEAHRREERPDRVDRGNEGPVTRVVRAPVQRQGWQGPSGWAIACSVRQVGA